MRTLTQLAFWLICCGFSTGALAQDAKAGEKKSSWCSSCHGVPGFKAISPEVHRVPMIGGQSGSYIVSALKAYKYGERLNPTMKGVAATLTDADMADLGAFYGAQVQGGAAAPAGTAAAPSRQAADLLKKGNCVSCHGENYSKPIAPAYPKIAGQHADYLFAALKAYQTDGNPQIGRKNPVMGGVARQFTQDELKVLANHVGSLQGDLHTVVPSRSR